jgi:hypothetical protein
MGGTKDGTPLVRGEVPAMAVCVCLGADMLRVRCMRAVVFGRDLLGLCGPVTMVMGLVLPTRFGEDADTLGGVLPCHHSVNCRSRSISAPL